MENIKTNYYAIVFLILFAGVMAYSVIRATKAIDIVGTPPAVIAAGDEN